MKNVRQIGTLLWQRGQYQELLPRVPSIGSRNTDTLVGLPWAHLFHSGLRVQPRCAGSRRFMIRLCRELPASPRFLGSVPHNVRPFDISLRSIALGEIHYACALRAEDVQPQA
jgi:hypothetical protein